MYEGHQSVFSLFLKSYGNRRFFSQGVRRHPGMLNSTWSLHLGKPPVMGYTFRPPIKEPVYFRIQEQLVSHIPRIAGDLRIQPPVKDLTRRSRNCSFHFEFKGLRRALHDFFSFFFLSLKYCSNRSRRSFQNRSYSRTHPATCFRGSPRNEM